ncbi:Transcription-associated protein 1 [Nosema bombycis CQ1]|uniref:Transcription-associated protein 1 n=1 Tax=Nosema bombycis (strain CQ1 / CVCC 102059) TaxID=578461 RepID=R0KSL7_NOSB1|nr:Transcription-associated protein 1 [Nosema bombycis CQ1]|eukprot:EOB13761.1 Transcription-associated protein 1 [Nosema bombycis CQ1]
MIQFILKYDLVLSPEFMNVYFYGENRVDGSLELAHVVSYMEHVIKSGGPQEVIQFLFEIIKKEWYKYPLNETTVSYLYTTIIPGDLILHKEMHKTTILNILRVAKEKNSINWKQCLPTIKGLVQEAGQTYATIFQLFCDYSIYLSPTTPYFVDFVCGCMNKEKSQCNSLINQVLFDLLLDIKTPVPFKIALFALLNQKFTSIFQEEDFFNLALSFFLKYRLAQPGSLSSLNELLYRGCTHPSPGIRTKFVQFLDEILPGDPQGRLVGLLEFDWSGCNKNQIPFIFTVLLLGCYDPSEIRMFDGSSALNYDSISSSLENFLFISPDSSLLLLHKTVSKFGRSSKNQLTSNLITPLIIEMSPFVNDSLTYVLLKATGCPDNVDYSKIKAGHLSFFEILNETKCNLSMYRETGIKDYVYGCLRATAKFPEVMQASVFQQFGKFKEAQKIYENLQNECVGSKVSFYEDEYENICKEWVECTKELQQWDVLYNIGNNLKGNKKGNDHTLIPSLKPIFDSLAADSLFFLSNFNLSNERETFQSVVGLMSKGIKKAFYELFYSIYQAPSSENFVDLIVQIIKKMASGPRTKEFNFYYSNLIQIVLEMHDTTSLFTFGAEAEERINGLSYAWEDREPLIEGPYEVLSMFSTWRRHFFRRIEGYSNEGTLLNENEVDEGDPRKTNISTGVNKTKEYSEAISKLRKTMYIKGNNELGRNANFLALAAYKKGYYDNALFLLKEVFELPSIKILDAYRKVVYELMCFYDMNENKLGLDLANSTNIVHFSDEQSSNIFRMRGMFSERIKDVEETKKLYFQAIQFFSSPENHFYYTNLLLKHFDYADIQDEVVSSCLQGLSISDSPYSKHLVMSLLLLLENHSVNYNLSLFKSLVKSVNVAYFVAFIPRMKKIQKNALYLRLIFDELMKKFPEAVVLNEFNNKKIVKISDKKGDGFDNKVGGIDNKINSTDNKVGNLDNNKETEDNENKDITRPISSPHNNPQDFKFLKSILSGLRDVFSLDEPAQKEVEMIEILTAFINHIVDSITDINTVPYLDRLIELSESYHYNLDLRHKDSLSLTDVVRHLDAIRKNLKNKLKTPGLLINNEKLDIVNKILTEKRLPLFGSFSKIQKDYSNVVCVESFDSYRVLRKEKNKKEVFLIGSDGRYYKYEINLNKESTSLPLLYHVLALEINNCYHLRSRDAFLHLVSTQEIGPGLHADVFDVNALSFEEITDRHSHDHLVEYVREYEKMCQTKPKDENSPSKFIENNIIRLLKPERINKNKTKRVLLADFFKSLKKDWSLPKINSKLRLKVYSKVLPFVSDALPSFLRSTSDSSFSFFMQKCAFSKSFALNLSINNFLKIKTKDPRNDAIEMYTGHFLRKNLVHSSAGDSLYISPGIQELIGIENLEGPFLSCLFLSSDFFLKNESFDLIMRYFDFDTVYAKEILKKVVSVEGNDHEIIKIVSGWTDVNLISRNKVSENVWN